MSAYADSSFLVSVLFRESSYKANLKELGSFDLVASSYFTQAEVLASLRREEEPLNKLAEFSTSIAWLSLVEGLETELTEVFEAGYLRGADAFHLATAIWFAGDADRSEVTFLTMDKKQKSVAAKLGFST